MLEPLRSRKDGLTKGSFRKLAVPPLLMANHYFGKESLELNNV